MEFLFNQVFKLKDTQQPVPFDVVPKPLMQDFLNFIQYRAVLKRGGVYLAQPNDFREWLKKLNQLGVDYTIDLNSYEVSSSPAD